jgi:hypothetical protein
VLPRSLVSRAGDDPIFPAPIINALIFFLALQHVLIGDFIFGVDLADIPTLPDPPVTPVDLGVGINGLMDSIQLRANNGVGGPVNRVSTLILGNQATAFQISFEPSPGLNWSNVLQAAGGIENLRTFATDSARTAVTSASLDASFALLTVTHGNTSQGVVIGVFRIQTRLIVPRPPTVENEFR